MEAYGKILLIAMPAFLFLVLFEKWYGTFQEELPNVTPVYGITRPVRTWNPVKINFQHVWLLIKDAWRTNNWKDKWRIWLMPTGWRPTDVSEKYPVYKIEDVYHFDKYDTKASASLHVWSWIQLVTMLLFVSYLFGNIATINQLDSSYIFVYAGFILLSIYACTELMDRNKYAIIWEALRCCFGIYLISQQGDWFGANTFIPGVSYALIAYFILSTIITGWFVYTHYKEDRLVRILS